MFDSPDKHTTGLGTGGAGAYKFISRMVEAGRLRFTVSMDARSYLETLPIDTLWLNKRDKIASAAIINHMGTLATTRDYGMFIVTDTTNHVGLLRRGDRAVQGVQGQPNLKIVGDHHYLWFEWKARRPLSETSDDPLSNPPDCILAHTESETFVTRPFIVMRRPDGESRISCLPVARIDGSSIVIRDLWIVPDNGILRWREERLTSLAVTPRTRALSLVNRILWAGGADFEPFCLGYTSQVSIGSAKLLSGFQTFSMPPT